jgi:Protein kinase domain/Tetratricopeptide repeat
MSAAPSPSPDEYLELGSVIDGRYRIQGILGGGGMARVYLAENVGIGRAVAIKILHANIAHSRDAVTRFRREAITSGRLEHPNIVSVLDFGVLHDGRCYLVMESLEGETLGDRLAREGRLPWRTAIALIRGVLVALQHAHDHGVVHRDIKPDNIFVLRRDHEPLVKLLDFGIAKLYAGSAQESRITQRGLTVGSPAYMSPEQAVDGEITPASDLYSATVVLFEMLTGRTPFDRGDSVATMKAHINLAPPRLKEVAAEVELPDALEDIVQAGLAKSVKDRVRSAGRMLAMLDRARTESAAAQVQLSRLPPAPSVPLPPRVAEGVAAGRPRRKKDDDARTMLVRAQPKARLWILLGTMIATVLVAVLVYRLVASRKERDATSAAAHDVSAGKQHDAAVAVAEIGPDALDVDAPIADNIEAQPDDIEIEPTDTVEPSPVKPPTRRDGGASEKRRDASQAMQAVSKGRSALGAGKFDEASKAFQQALAADPKAHAALDGLAEVSYNRGDFSGAVMNAKRAVALSPKTVGYRMTLAKAYYKLMRYDDAIGEWRKVLLFDPNNALAKENVEMAKSKLGR